MFFQDRIKNIKPTDKVLEIGPGADPHPRSNVLLEKKFANEAEYASQFGNSQKLVTDKPVVFYEGDVFPFADKEFDYVICSHVLEHVENVEQFLSEVFRVAHKGYFEYPLAYYEYLYNFDVHINYLKYDNDCLKYMKKRNSGLNEFRPIQDFFYQSLQKGYDQLIRDLIHLFMEGFEWDKPFRIKEVKELKDICYTNLSIPVLTVESPASPTFFQIFKLFVRKIIGSAKTTIL
ncbi:MAG TPA: class I SAM-dependent methyltransferase [Bacteroidia bacterium]|jgi:SAM-dependent methyltransferase|nr:class I SAM-dependent methyltransferase [Bacteroidia bacterium]